MSQLTLDQLSERIEELKALGYGSALVDLITEVEATPESQGLQVENPMGDLAYVRRDHRVKLLPVDF